MPQNIIPYGKQSTDQDDVEAVITTLKSDFLTQGQKLLNSNKSSQIM